MGGWEVGSCTAIAGLGSQPNHLFLFFYYKYLSVVYFHINFCYQFDGNADEGFEFRMNPNSGLKSIKLKTKVLNVKIAKTTGGF